jgi:hypothetical protein
MLHYILQTTVFQLIFLLVYEFWLKKETFFVYNRAYLLLTPVLALLLPLLRIPELQNAISTENFVLLPEVLIGAAPEAISANPANAMPAKVSPLLNPWLVIYTGGFLFSLGFFFNKLRLIRQLFSFKPLINTSEIKIVEVPDSTIACTFYKTVFLGASLPKKEREQILSHEKVHVKQKHTLDLLFFELLRIVFWFNPMVYIYQSRISALHEFMADAGVVKNVKKQEYFQQLLNSAFNTRDISFINQFFNHSIIKKRIVMLQKTKSNSVSKFKFLIILPLMAAMLTYVACSSSKTGNEQVTNQLAPPPPPPAPEPSTSVPKVGQEMLDIPFAVVEQVPVYPGCEDLQTIKARKECIAQKITQFVNTNFNTSLAKASGLTGLNRIYVQFRITKDGNVEVLGARAPHPALEEEARRVVNLLPKMTPGKQRGEEVGVLYSLPISFMVPEATPEAENASGN